MLKLMVKTILRLLVFSLLHPIKSKQIYSGSFKAAFKILGFIIIHPNKTRVALEAVKKPCENKPLVYKRIKVYKTKNKNLIVSKHIQYDAFEIIKLAESISRKANSKQDFAEKAFNWVRNNVEFGFCDDQSALTTLNNKRGLCFGNFNLLAALCRSQKIPTRFKYARISSDRKITNFKGISLPLGAERLFTLVLDFIANSFPHLFLEVYINEKWLEVDPTITPEFSAFFGYHIQRFSEPSVWAVDHRDEFIYTTEVPTVLVDLINFISNKTFSDCANENYNACCKEGEKILIRYGSIERYNILMEMNKRHDFLKNKKIKSVSS